MFFRNCIKIINISILAALALVLGAGFVLAAPPGGHQVIGLFVQPGDYTPATFRLYDVSVPSKIAVGTATYESGYTVGSDGINDGVMNAAPTEDTGNTVLTIFERETNSGTVNHTGYYSVTNSTLDGEVEILSWGDAPHAIPVPVATQGTSGAIDLSWAAAIDDGTNNIVGYKVYRSPTGLVADYMEIATVPATSTSTVDSTTVAGKTYYYALSILFRGTLATPEVESLYLSANSSPATPSTPGVSIISVTPYSAVQGTQNLDLTIIGRGTNFNGTSTVSFEGLNHISLVGIPIVISSTEIHVTIDVSSEAQIGPRNVVVGTTLPGPLTEVAVGQNMFWVTPASPTETLLINPNSGVRGATFNVTITGSGTNFDQLSSVAYFGNDITINLLTVNSSTSAVANITIGKRAALGTRIVMMSTGSELAVGDFVVKQLNNDDKIIPNYPNPFDPQREVTHIVIILDEPTEVGIYLYDITARQVWKNKIYLPAGQNQVDWNGYTYFNKIADNGVYILRVADEGSKKFIGKGKVLVIKR